MLHLAGTIVQGCAVGIACTSIGRLSSIARVEGGKLIEEGGELGSAVEEDDKHGSGETDSEGQLVLVHGCRREPIKDALPCTTLGSQ